MTHNPTFPHNPILSSGNKPDHTMVILCLGLFSGARMGWSGHCVVGL